MTVYVSRGRRVRRRAARAVHTALLGSAFGVLFAGAAVLAWQAGLADPTLGLFTFGVAAYLSASVGWGWR